MEIQVYSFDKERYKNILYLLGMFSVGSIVLNKKEKVVCCLEKVGAMPNQGVTSMFHFGENYGYIQGLLEANGIQYELVTPQKWKKEFGVTSDKNTSIEVCKRLFPNVNLKRTERCRKDDDGFAESCLLAEYCRRKFK